ncbi:MAG: YHS domain-containing protein [Gemmatimonadales bacterium]
MKVRDEVCGMEFEDSDAAAKSRFDGTVYYFCSERCKRMFKEHPDRYVVLGGDAQRK